MAGKKRALEDGASNQKAKKAKSSGKSHKESLSGDPLLTTEEVDFPRGGGTTLTPLEVKEIRTEAVREADNELFSVSQVGAIWSRLLTISRPHRKVMLSGRRAVLRPSLKVPRKIRSV